MYPFSVGKVVEVVGIFLLASSVDSIDIVELFNQKRNVNKG